MSSRLSSTCGPCFAASNDLSYKQLFVDYEFICTEFPGWSLEEVRNMPKRERSYWYRASGEKRKIRIKRGG